MSHSLFLTVFEKNFPHHLDFQVGFGRTGPEGPLMENLWKFLLDDTQACWGDVAAEFGDHQLDGLALRALRLPEVMYFVDLWRKMA